MYRWYTRTCEAKSLSLGNSLPSQAANQHGTFDSKPKYVEMRTTSPSTVNFGKANQQNGKREKSNKLPLLPHNRTMALPRVCSTSKLFSSPLNQAAAKSRLQRSRAAHQAGSWDGGEGRPNAHGSSASHEAGSGGGTKAVPTLPPRIPWFRFSFFILL